MASRKNGKALDPNETLLALLSFFLSSFTVHSMAHSSPPSHRMLVSQADRGPRTAATHLGCPLLASSIFGLHLIGPMRARDGSITLPIASK